MYRRSGIAAVLATGLMAITAGPALADPGPILPLPTIVSITLLPKGDPATSTTPADTQTTQTAPKTSTGETSTVRTARPTGHSTGGAAQRGTAATPAPSPTPTLRPAAPRSPHSTSEADAGLPSSAGQQAPADNLVAALVAITIAAFAALAVISTRRRPRVTPPPPPTGSGPESPEDDVLIAVYRDGYGDGYVDAVTLKEG